MKFLVIGDIMIDRYVIGKVNRISPEAPVQIVDMKFQYDALGGAANCARNISTITGEGTVDIAGSVGTDEAGGIAVKLLKAEGIKYLPMSLFNDKPTIIKERIFADNQQLIRIDIEDKHDIEFNPNALTHEMLEKYDIIIVSDYAKGVVTQALMDWIGAYKDKIVVDPKPENWSLYPEVLLVTPNEKEFHKMRWRNTFLPEYILVTKGKEGMVLHEFRNNDKITEIKSVDVPNSEVIGAGDTVTSIMAICLQRGVDMINSAKIANECAAYSVSQKGTVVVPKNIFENIFHKELYGELEDL